MIQGLRAADLFVPDGDEARRQAAQELAKGEYQAAKPNWFDQLAGDVVEWIAGLLRGDGTGAFAPLILTVIAIVIVSAVAVALIVWGRPRAPRTVRRRPDLLGERDDRTAAQLRAEAERRAKAQDWDSAVVLRFRALARSLIERDLIDPAPGSTAQAIARDASRVMPASRSALHDAATSFDAVRYLRSPADEDDYRAVTATDTAVLHSAPQLDAPAMA